MTNESKAIYKTISDAVSCELCSDLLVDPVECMAAGCGTTVCRRCWNANREANGSGSSRAGGSLEGEREPARICQECGLEPECRPSRSMLRFLDKLRWYCRNRDLGCDVESV